MTWVKIWFPFKKHFWPINALQSENGFSNDSASRDHEANISVATLIYSSSNFQKQCHLLRFVENCYFVGDQTKLFKQSRLPM